MLFVQTDNYKQQSILQQFFSRQGNLFAVPFKATNQINSILQKTIYQIFRCKFQQEKCDNKQSQQLPQLAKKVKNFIENILKLKFSLTDLRQILELICYLNVKANLLQQYYCKMSIEIQNQEIQNQQLYIYKTPQKQIYRNFTFNQQYNKAEQLHQNADNNGKQLQCLSENSTTSHSHNRAKNIEMYQQNLQNTMFHSLKSQFPSSPKFAFKQNIQIRKDISSQELLQAQNLVNVDYEIQNGTPGAHLERPSWNQKKFIGKKSDFIESLSGRIQPLPSFLHEQDCLGQLIAKQKKQDVMKSKILKEAIKKSVQSSLSGDDKLRDYSKSIRDIKLNNKLRKSSRKSITNLKNTVEQARDDKKQSEKPGKGTKFFKQLKQSIMGHKNTHKNQQRQKFFGNKQDKVASNIEPIKYNYKADQKHSKFKIN